MAGYVERNDITTGMNPMRCTLFIQLQVKLRMVTMTNVTTSTESA